MKVRRLGACQVTHQVCSSRVIRTSAKEAQPRLVRTQNCSRRQANQAMTDARARLAAAWVARQQLCSSEVEQSRVGRCRNRCMAAANPQSSRTIHTRLHANHRHHNSKYISYIFQQLITVRENWSLSLTYMYLP